MGKYIEKGKRKVEVGAAEEDMEVSPSPSPSPLGVRTRAKTKSLALQRLQKAKSKSKSKSKSAKSPPSSSAASAASSSLAKSESCYLQLRSRRLEKSSATKPTKAASPKASQEEVEEENGAAIEVSFGENVLDAEGAGSRNSRETTPCSLIKRDSETIGTPGSTNRPTSSTANNRRIQSSTPRNIPYTREMEEFFAEPEERQQKEFAEKYNFDPVKDSPLPGRYEWVKLKN